MPTATLAGAADDDAFDRACHLVMTELNAIPLTYDPGDPRSRRLLTRSHKAALIAHVHRSVRYLTEAFRVVDAAYPDLTVDGRCTDAAVIAACGPLYGGLDRYLPATQTRLRAEARSILTHALAAVTQTKAA